MPRGKPAGCTSMNSDDWTAIATCANVVVVSAAVWFAASAWKAQQSFARDERQRDVVRRVGDTIANLTMGEVATARDQVTSWIDTYRDCQTEGARRGDHLTGSYSNEAVRRQVFVLLWAIQRLAPLASDLAVASSAQRETLRVHIDLIVMALKDLAALLDDEERWAFTDSASAAAQAAADVGSKLHSDYEQALNWPVALAGFSMHVEIERPAATP